MTSFQRSVMKKHFLPICWISQYFQIENRTTIVTKIDQCFYEKNNHKCNNGKKHIFLQQNSLRQFKRFYLGFYYSIIIDVTDFIRLPSVTVIYVTGDEYFCSTIVCNKRYSTPDMTKAKQMHKSKIFRE